MKNSKAVLSLLREIAAQEPFTYGPDTPLGTRQVFDLTTKWTERARAILPKLTQE